MPLVLMNPQIKPITAPVNGPEGCLSFPEVFADINRPEQVEVTGLNERGEKITFRCGGLLSRAVQHETDHLNGILFIDRLSEDDRKLAMKEIRESDWFGMASAIGGQPQIKVSPHDLFGRGL